VTEVRISPVTCDVEIQELVFPSWKTILVISRGGSMGKCTNLEIAIVKTTDMITWFRETSPETPALQKTLIALEGQLTLLNKELEKCLG
jgi:hypothetical protein